MHGELRQVADLALFAKIVQTGGISRCASDLGLERTTVSRRLGSLEQSLGVKLLDRSPKHIAVTEAGLRCLEYCERLLEAASNAQSLATMGSIVASSAPIVMGAPPDIIDRYLETKLADFEATNPGVSIERRPVTLWNDTVLEAVDLGVALAPVSIGAAWTNTIATIPQSLFASTEYASQHSAVLSPFDLESHACIVEDDVNERHVWKFAHNDRATAVNVNAKFVVSGLLEAREAALAGLGIARLPRYLCDASVRAGRLVDLLPDTECVGRDIVMISPHHGQRKTGTAALRLHLEGAFKTSIC